MKNLPLLAKKAAELFLRTESFLMLPSNLDNKSLPRRGVFVTIKNGNILRGCVGTYLPSKNNIFKETISSAIAATNDYRFQRITVEELPLLTYEVSIIGKPQLIRSRKKLDPKKFGIIVEDRVFRRGLLLPNIDGIACSNKQLNIACKKAGISSKKGISVYRFKCAMYSFSPDHSLN